MRLGSAAHRPLTRREVAVELGVHESTVSRVVAGKLIGLPSGPPVPLASFFGQADDVLRSLRSLVDGEAEPLSDAALAALLARQGHAVARRTWPSTGPCWASRTAACAVPERSCARAQPDRIRNRRWPHSGDAWVSTITQRVAVALQHAVADGELRDHRDPDTAAALLVGPLLFAAAFQASQGEEDVDSFSG